MATGLLPLNRLGAIETNGSVAFGVCLPWLSANDGNRVSVRVIHEADRFLQHVPAREFPLNHGQLAPYGDYWSATVPIAGPPSAGSAWGSPGTYLYRYVVHTPTGQELDWILDPVSREFGSGKQSAFTLGYTPYVWSAAEAEWRVPAQSDLVLYELDISEFGGDLRRASALMPYLQDLGVNAVEVMPLSNVGGVVDWGYLPIGYFGVDERFGNRADFQAFVDVAHQHGIAVLVDMVYGHSGVDFPYYDLYTRLAYDENPFMGTFAQDLFSAFGKSTDFRRQLTRDYFHSVSAHWLETYHVDGIRYDCVPNFWDGPMGDGYASSVYELHQLTKRRIAEGAPYWRRFDAGDGTLRLIQCAEQLEDPQGVLQKTYSSSSWQNGTYDAARKVAEGDRGRIEQLGLSLGAFGYPSAFSVNGDRVDKLALQYIENHDHERFVCHFGVYNPDDAQNGLFLQGDRSRWFKVQPYLIALLLSKGIPMLWEGQELCENYCLPDSGTGRVQLLRSVRWDYFYDEPGRATIALVRKLLALRRQAEQFRVGDYFFFNHWQRYASRGVLAYARWTQASYSLVIINTTDEEQTVPFWFPISGTYREELHGGTLQNVVANEERWLQVPSNYGRVWSVP